jgi:hypothetical protein
LIIMQLLITSDSRTTDLLELITMDSLIPVIIDQTCLSDHAIQRESCLVTEKGRLHVSHNFVLINPSFIPRDIVVRITEKGEGIGHVLRERKVRNTRRMIHCGSRNSSEIVDLFQKPSQLRFQDHPRIPFKEYTIQFHPYMESGIHVIEYFNPDMLRENMNAMSY